MNLARAALEGSLIRDIKYVIDGHIISLLDALSPFLSCLLGRPFIRNPAKLLLIGGLIGHAAVPQKLSPILKNIRRCRKVINIQFALEEVQKKKCANTSYWNYSVVIIRALARGW